MERVLTALNALLPLAFGLGFLAPVIAVLCEAAGTPAPLGVGVAIGGGWGLVATLTGRWI